MVVIRFFLSSSDLLEIHAERFMNELQTSRIEVKKDMEYKLWEICLRIMLSVVNLSPLGVPPVI